MAEKIKTKTIFKFWFITVEKWLERDVLSIEFKLPIIKSFWIRLTKWFDIYLFSRITEDISLEVKLGSGNNDTYFETSIGRYGDHYLYTLQFSLHKLISFDIFLCDDREWDYYKNKRTYDIYDYYHNTTLTYPVGVKPHFKERRKKAKWFLNTQYFKIYNLDWLNNPWGLTFDFAWFPLLLYTKFSYGIDKYEWFQFNCEISKHTDNALRWTLRLNILSMFVEFEIGENTVIREANTYFYDDFRTLEVFNADINHVGESACCNAIITQVINKNLPYLYALLEWHKFDFDKINTDEILEYAASKDLYNKEIFELVIKHINFIKNWDEEIEKFKPDLDDNAYKKLLEIKNNPVPDLKKELVVNKQNIIEKISSWFKEHFRFSIYKSLIGLDWLIYIKGIGFNSFKFTWRKVHKYRIFGDYESNFHIILTRDFWIKNYLLTQFDCWKQLSIKISHNNVYPFSVDSDIFGIWQNFNIGAITEDPFYNFKKQRLMTAEEHILEHHLNKVVDTDEPNERKKKYKEFYNNHGIKIYNNNYLHNPYGRTIEFNLPFNHYLKFSFNHQHYYEFKNETNLEFTWNFDNKKEGRIKHRFIRFKLSAFKHYFKIVLGENTIARPSIIHSNKSLSQFKNKNIEIDTLIRLFDGEIKEHETKIYKKIINLGIDLTEYLHSKDFNDLIYHLGFTPYHHKPSFNYLLQVAKDNHVRFYISDELKNSTNIEIIKALKEEYASDFEEPILNQLIEYIENQKEVE